MHELGSARAGHGLVSGPRPFSPWAAITENFPLERGIAVCGPETIRVGQGQGQGRG